MSLPKRYRHHLEYFQSVLEFLNKYSWIYRTANTRFLKDDILDHLPEEWNEYFMNLTLNEFNNFPLKKLYNLPSSLQLFYDELNDLSPNYENHKTQRINKNSINLFKEVSVKKNHEILQLSETIIEFCNNHENKIDLILDFGCGLGYLSQILYERGNCKILGIESEEERVKTAIKRQQKYYPSSKGYVHFVQHKITNESSEFILNKIKEFYPEKENCGNDNDDENLPNLCIVGLHTCADLFITVINLFFKLKCASKLVCMPCCYHKFQIYDNLLIENLKCPSSSFSNFQQFPISRELITACNWFNSNENFNGNQISDFINRPFLRLACQQTASRWKNMSEIDHRNHGREMFIRAIAECLIEDTNNEFIIKIKNHLNNSKNQLVNDNLNSEINFNDIRNNYEIRSKLSKNKIEWNDKHQMKFIEILERYSSGDKLAESLICLQTSMQELCENLVLLDRMCYISNSSKKQNLYAETRLYKIMDDAISPRCFAILSSKLH